MADSAEERVDTPEDRADFLIVANEITELANRLAAGRSLGRMNAAMMWAAARYHAHGAVIVNMAPAQATESIIDAFTAEYRRNLAANMSAFLAQRADKH